MILYQNWHWVSAPIQRASPYRDICKTTQIIWYLITSNALNAFKRKLTIKSVSRPLHFSSTPQKLLKTAAFCTEVSLIPSHYGCHGERHRYVLLVLYSLLICCFSDRRRRIFIEFIHKSCSPLTFCIFWLFPVALWFWLTRTWTRPAEPNWTESGSSPAWGKWWDLLCLT